MNGLLYDFVLRPVEAFYLGKLRSELLQNTSGKTLEIGVGTGTNLSHYPARTFVIGIGPDEAMSQRINSKKVSKELTFRFQTGSAENLSFGNDEFETVVATMVLCTVNDPKRTLREVHRVLKPGGLLLLLEHVRSPYRIGTFIQGILDPLWKKIAGGCHLDREPTRALEELNFKVLKHKKLLFGHGKLWVLQKAQT